MRHIAWIVGVVVAAAILSGCSGLPTLGGETYIVPSSSTTLYGKTPPAEGVVISPDETGAACAHDYVEISLGPDGEVGDSGQTVRVLEWPDAQEGGTIVLLLERSDGGTVWSYTAVIGYLDDKLVGTPGALSPLGVFTEKLIIYISTGDEIPAPDEVALCRKESRG